MLSAGAVMILLLVGLSAVIAAGAARYRRAYAAVLVLVESARSASDIKTAHAAVEAFWHRHCYTARHDRDARMLRERLRAREAFDQRAT